MGIWTCATTGSPAANTIRGGSISKITAAHITAPSPKCAVNDRRSEISAWGLVRSFISRPAGSTGAERASTQAHQRSSHPDERLSAVDRERDPNVRQQVPRFATVGGSSMPRFWLVPSTALTLRITRDLLPWSDRDRASRSAPPRLVVERHAGAISPVAVPSRRPPSAGGPVQPAVQGTIQGRLLMTWAGQEDSKR